MGYAEWVMCTYADDEFLWVHELVIEDGIEDGRAELACGTGKS
jgi:hypothetical protein